MADPPLNLAGPDGSSSGGAAILAYPDDITERRGGTRRAINLNTCLIPLNGADAIRCRTDDVSEGGMHVTVPIGYGLAVGQRFELQLAAPGASLGMGPLLTAPGCYVTVVRTRLHVGADGDRVAVGLRFDQPLPLGGNA